MEHNSNRGISVAVLALSFVALLILSASPALAARALNCSIDNCYGISSAWALNGMDFNDDFSSNPYNSQRWNMWTTYGATNTVTFDGSVMSIGMTPYGGGWSSAGVRSWYKLRGDFDIQVDYKNLVRGTSADGGIILHVDDDNGDNYYVRRQLNSQRMDMIAQTNSASVDVVLVGSVTLTSGSLRLTRSGGTMCSYYSTSIGGAWTQVGCNTSIEWAQDVSPLVQFALQNPSGTNTVEFDNFRIVSGQIVPDTSGALYNASDSFTATTTDVDKWDFTYGNAGFNGSALVLNMTPSGGWVAHGAQTKYRLVGDFDVQIDYKDFVAGSAIDGGVAFLLIGPGDDDAFLIRRQFVNSNGYQVFEHRNNGAWNLVGNTATTDTTSKMRMTRSGNTMTAYYWNGASWTSAGSYSSDEFRQPMNLRLELSGASPADTKYVKYDNLKLNSGTTTLSDGNIGYTSGANYTTGKYGTALQFNGISDYVAMGTFNPPNPHNITLMAWINMTSLGVTNGYYTNYIIAKGADANANSYGIFIGSGNSAFSSSAPCIMVATGSGYQPLCAPVGLLTPGRWHHVTGVIEGQAFRIYLDGQLKNSGTFTGTINRGTQNVRIGNQDRTSYEFRFKGQIDEPTFWGRALTDGEVSALFGLGGTLPNVTTFTTGTTNFSNVADVENVPNMTLATAATVVRWTGLVNASGKNFDQYVNMGPGFVSLDVAALGQTVNTTAVVNITGINCENFDLYYATGVHSSLASLKSVGVLVATQQNLNGNCLDATKCTAISCANGVLTFTAQHFDGFGGDNGTDQPVPEFGTWALMIALGLVAGGIVTMRKK